MVATTKSARAYELPIPSFFDPNKVDQLWRVPYSEREAQAKAWAAQHSVKSASKDKTRICFMPVDVQITFCHPDAALYVGGRSGKGAVDDTRRMCEWIYKNLGIITTISPTMDTHSAFQIFHPVFWVDERGNHPGTMTMIAAADVRSGKWRVNPAAAYAVLGDPAKYTYLQAFASHYVETLTSGGKYPLMLWPYHAMLGSIDHALVPSLQEAAFFHTIARGSQTQFEIKGGNPMTENYSVFQPEVLVDQKGRPIAQKNSEFLNALLSHDYVVIGGEAKSHCVAWAIADLLGEIKTKDPALARKVYLVEDFSSPVVVPQVVDFTDQADEAYRKFAAEGMNVVLSTTPIEDWPGITLK